MKQVKVVLLLSVVTLFAFSATAQPVVGVKGGLNFASLSGFSGDDRVSAHVGIFLHNTLNKHWCFQPEILYSGEGQKYFVEGENRTLALSYITIPLMMQYFPLEQLYFEAGPQFGILVAAQDKRPGVNVNVKNDFSNAEVGLNVGVGVLATKRLGFYGRYHFGFTDVSLFDNVVDHSLVGQVGATIRLK